MRRRSGFTLTELAIVLAVLALMVVWGLANPSSTRSLRDDAAAVAATLRHARLHAIVVGRAAPVSGDGCSAVPSVELASVSRAEMTVPARGLQFSQDGLPRTCDGGGIGNTTILLEHRGRQAAVIVSSLGRVRWELR